MYSTNVKTTTSYQATKVCISLGAVVLLGSHQGEAEARVGLEDLHATPRGLPVLVVGVGMMLNWVVGIEEAAAGWMGAKGRQCLWDQSCKSGRSFS